MGVGFLFWAMKMFANQMVECTKCHRVVRFKMVNVMWCVFHLNLERGKDKDGGEKPGGVRGAPTSF